MILGCFDLMAKAGARAFEVKRESFDRYNDDADDQLRRMIWNHPSIRHRHATPKGRLLGYYPWRLIKAWEDSRRPDPSEYVLS
jgi:4-hydroxyacetophenone monooxygenase